MNDDIIMDKIDERCNEILEDLGKTKMDDAAYGTKVKNLETLTKIKADQETRDQNRTNNNARNDIEEIKVRLEEEKLKVQKQGQILSVVQTVGYGGLACLFAKISYKGDLTGLANRPIMDMGRKLFDTAKGFFRR